MKNLALMGCILALLSAGLAPAVAVAQASGTTPQATAQTDAAKAEAARAEAAKAAANASSTTTTTTNPAPVNPNNPAGLTEKSVRALLQLFVLAVLLESALALLFNWRPFLAIFDGRGVKSIISLAASLVLVFTFHIDAIRSLMTDFSGAVPDNTFSKILTAMVVAGGSSGVNNLLRAMGFRQVARADDVAPKPPPDQAWLSVAVVSRAVVDPKASISVEIMEDGGPYQIAGVITGLSSPGNVWRYFIRDPGRLPQSGGLALKPGATYEVRISGLKRDGTLFTSPAWGPNALRAGAIVDIQFKA
jgi:hypothetical protein